MTIEQIQMTISRLNGRSQIDAFEAAKAIWDDSDLRLERPLILTLKKGRTPFNRAAAAFAMQMVATPRTIRALESVVADKSESPRVRGEAAEALAHRHRRKSHDVLLKGLSDSSKDVRFWCAFALGEMAEKRAIPFLKGLVATDKRIVKGFHSVAKEASDAIENIEIGNVTHRRKGGCLFCVRGDA
jgi:HEAT repeat protein